MQKLFNNFFVVYLRNREKTKINPLSLLGTYKTTTNDITISICSCNAWDVIKHAKLMY